MFRPIIAATAILFALTGTTVSANPKKAPDIAPRILKELENRQDCQIRKANEELERDRLSANYYTEFTASVALPVPLYSKVSSGDGYVIVQKLFAIGDTLPAYGNALGVYEDGKWRVDVNILDVQMPGGRPFSQFEKSGRVVLEAGTDAVLELQAGRAAAMEAAKALKAQDVRLEDAELRLEAELKQEWTVLAAQREAAARAATELARLEAEQQVSDEHARMVAEREKQLQASDKANFALLNTNATYRAEATHGNRRVQGVRTITESGENHASGVLKLDLGGGSSYQSTLVFTSARKAGQVVFRHPPFDGFRESRDVCETVPPANLQAGVIAAEGGSPSYCNTDRIIVEISAPS